MAGHASGRTDAIPADLDDALRYVFGRSSVQAFRKLWEELNADGDYARIRQAFLRGMVYGLPSVPERIFDFSELEVPQSLEERKIWNVFLQNPHACGIAATMIWLHMTKQPPLGSRKLAEAAVPHYLSFATFVSHKVADTYMSLLTSEKPERKAIFDNLVKEVDSIFDDSIRKEVAEGIYVLIESLLIVREKREEETALTLDLRLPLSCSWDLLLELANRGKAAILSGTGLLDGQTLLKELPHISMDQIVEELERVGRYAGRGVCELSLRDKRTASPAGLFRRTKVWPDHSEAPLSMLYGLDWPLPSERDPPNLRLVLLGNSTISIQLQNDPFFEFLLGNWSYVDVVGKSRLIASVIGKDAAEKEFFIPTFYRIARLAHQLAYHNHGATIDVNFGPPKEIPDKLSAMKNEWDVTEIESDGLPLPPSPGSKGESEAEEDKKRFGRLAYTLTLQDGLSIWALTGDGNKIRLHDFGRYVDVRDEEIQPLWELRAPEMGLNPKEPIKGGRHRAAYVQSTWRDGQRKVVFCVSQDGFIEAFIDGRSLRLR